MLVISILTVLWFILHTVDCSCDLGSFGIHSFGPDCRFMCHCKNNEQCDDSTGECSSGCASFWYGPGCQYRDVAEGEFSRQSDNLDSPHQQYANFANDGNSETCSSTAEVNSMVKQTNPFWRVWLPTTERISELMILTKVEKLNHFEGFEVYVENVTANERENNELKREDSQKCYRRTGDTPRNESIKVLCENPVVGNQVRIQLKTLRSQLVLCDVKINGGRNLAFDRDVSQTQSRRDTKPASYAVDGHDRQSVWTECSYTVVDSPLLKLDIGRNALIWFIRVLSYKDIRKKIDKNLRLQLADDKTSLIEKTVDIYPQTQSANITLNTSVARYVTITKPGKFKRLQICELKVFGDCLEDECGFDCSKTCHCKYTNIWDKMDGKCSSGCKYGWTGKSCDQRSGTDYQQSCGHCLDSTGCDTSTGKCRTGCQDGYHPPDCKKECQRGRYGQNCRDTCPANCNYGVCDKFDGKCQSGCKPGYIGETCENKCRKGKYGENCTLNCSDNCKIDGKCNNVDGSCVDGCKPGFSGRKCDQECQSGRYGRNCRDTCSSGCNDDLCNSIHGKCRSGCKPGFNGEKCDNNCRQGEYGQNCSLKCSDNCMYYERCNNVDGTCVHGCKPGYSDGRCEQKCQSGRYGRNCRDTCSSGCNDGVCDNVDGKCQSGCKPGYFGEKCEKNCPYGKYGQNCTLKCSNNCKYGRCNNVDGTCVHGCKTGYSSRTCEQECQSGRYGENCRVTCPSSCNDGVCDNVDGKCQSGCKPGYFGEKCEKNCRYGNYGQNCSLKCSDNCKYDGQCNNVDGTCVHGCKTGYSSRTCEQECPDGKYGQNCAKTCSQKCTDGLCDNVDGKCIHGCKPGYIGTNCEQKCDKGMYGEVCIETSGYCLAGVPCDHENGTCLDGCLAGYHGQLCKSKCTDGHWGQDCISVCGHCADSSTCSIYTGTCPGACRPGWLQPLCIYAESHVEKDGQFNSAAIIIGPTVAVVTGVAVIITLLLVLKRRNSLKPGKPVEANDGTSAPDINEYERVDLSRVDVEQETQYTELQLYEREEEAVVAGPE